MHFLRENINYLAMKNIKAFLIILSLTLCVSTQSFAAVTATDLKTSFAPIVKQTAGSVVNIFTEKVTQRRTSPFSNDPFFRGFFDDFFTAPMRSRVEKSLGSGVVVTPKGHVVTNYHVINGATAIKVVFNDGREVDAEVINADKRVDIAVLELNIEEETEYLPFGDSDGLEVGDVILAIGNPYGVGQSVSMGIVSALGRSNLGVNQFENFIQTDAAINPGNSGGALVDSNGYLIGINTAIFSKSGGYQGIGFATPINAVKTIVTSILETGSVVRPWLGATGQNLTPDLSESLGLKTPRGVLINEVGDGTPAQKAGLMVGDIIVEMNGFEIDNTFALNSRIAGSSITEESRMKVLRNGKYKELYLQFEALPERSANDQRKLEGRHPLRGVVVEQIGPALIQQLDLPLDATGLVVVTVPNQSYGIMSLGIRPGDILVSINNVEIKKFKDLETVLSKRSRAWNITYKRGNKVYRTMIQQ